MKHVDAIVHNNLKENVLFTCGLINIKYFVKNSTSISRLEKERRFVCLVDYFSYHMAFTRN